MKNQIVFLVVTSVLLTACSSKINSEQLVPLTQISCRVNENIVGEFNENISFSLDMKEVVISGETFRCTEGYSQSNCNTYVNSGNQFTFYSLNAYTYKTPGPGSGDIVVIEDGMIKNIIYFKMECIKR